MKFWLCFAVSFIVLVGVLLAMETAYRRSQYASKEEECRKHGTVVYGIREFICMYDFRKEPQ